MSTTPNAFIFSLRNKEGLGPFKSMVVDPTQAIVRTGRVGPVFGNGYDIYIADFANSNNKSYTDYSEYNSYHVDHVDVFYLV